MHDNGWDSLDNMSMQDVIRLYYEKHHAIRQGDMLKLIEMKKSVPALFVKEQDDKIRRVILSIKCFQQSERYQQLKKIYMKKKFSVLRGEES